MSITNDDNHDDDDDDDVKLLKVQCAGRPVGAIGKNPNDDNHADDDDVDDDVEVVEGSVCRSPCGCHWQ